MPDKVVLFTGAGGFLGRYILRHYLDETDYDLYLLEHGPFRDSLKAHLDATVQDPKRRAAVRVLDGDITKPGLGLEPALQDELRRRVTHAIHLAALYNLSVTRDVAMRINVDGTQNVLDFLETVEPFQKLAHTSTLAVAGTHVGAFSEDDFDKGQGFKNYYEETKFLSEKLVRERWTGKVPAVVMRPSVVVGDSKTGYIEKIDGPYYAMITVARGLHWMVPDSGPTKCHIAPVDFVTDAFFALFEKGDAPPGTVYSLMDPNPITYNDFLDLVCDRWPKRRPLFHVSPRLMAPIARTKLFEMLTGIPWTAFLYAGQPIDYNLEKSTAALARLGITCPPVSSYVDVMIRYFREHYRDANVRREGWWK